MNTRVKDRTKSEDYGAIEGCALTDVLSEIMASLRATYYHLCEAETRQKNPDREQIERWEKRKQEIVFLRQYFGRPEVSYEDMRRWIELYGRELKDALTIRVKYTDAA